ncbi:histidine phosphatase family protein [Fluoribacter dumoffii]|uniref:Uncharacterized protein n=1 Tax=Fluoribacter dumoffii TaxID=463 RepID=A0A377G8A5_9GAMM|nr:histidine phosphatase family protein [Fluoribacter dumoffii]KTC89589.1 coiled-coil protein [Fluoribacter dumoffii NY 23]MCW8384782.1 histidine phosphatase family protein [Fluoribacter dumoffii]MCW8496818.1 histidine phosphatase family protein [Fluoribacter dumoffii]STO20700.1 Uncharacterised protein [Fluoribacter dumoffii]
MLFYEIVKIMQNELAHPHQYNNPELLYQSLEREYLREINSLVYQLNHSRDEEARNLLAKIQETDRLYLKARGLDIIAHILFSRHGECRLLGQKKLGLSPNTAISEAAEQNMATTNQLSGALLFYPLHNQTPLIAVSPMNRAMQTASLVLPREIRNADIRVLPCLTEISIAPSGYDVRSLADMQTLYNQLSFWTSPIKKLLLKLSLWMYSDQDFSKLYEKRRRAAEKIQQHGNEILSDDDKPDVVQSLNFQGSKINETRAVIERLDHQDGWFFGHGKNFRAFFEDVFNIKSDFDYGETRRIYKTVVNGTSSFHSPPYVLVISQKNGTIKAKYTGASCVPISKKSANATLPATGEVLPDISRAMSQLGSSLDHKAIAEAIPEAAECVAKTPCSESQIPEYRPLMNKS